MIQAHRQSAQPLSKKTNCLVPPVFSNLKIRSSMACQVSVVCNRFQSAYRARRLALKRPQFAFDGVESDKFFSFDERKKVGVFISPDFVKGRFFSGTNNDRQNARTCGDESKKRQEFFTITERSGQYRSAAQDAQESKNGVESFIEVFGQAVKRDGIGDVQSGFVWGPFIIPDFHDQSLFVLESEAEDSAQAAHYFLLAFPWERFLQKDWSSLDSKSGSIKRVFPPLFLALEVGHVEAG